MFAFLRFSFRIFPPVLAKASHLKINDEIIQRNVYYQKTANSLGIRLRQATRLLEELREEVRSKDLQLTAFKV